MQKNLSKSIATGTCNTRENGSGPAPRPPTQSRWLVPALLLGFLLIIIVPSLKSPDESDHLRRAFMLTKGTWLLHTLPCADETKTTCPSGTSMSGGEIDSGFADYLGQRNPNTIHKETAANREQTKSIQWSGQLIFQLAPGTGYYFPAAYLPQGIGLTIGRKLGWNVDRSVTLARGFSLLATLLVLAIAFRIYRPQPMTIALLLLPMSLFQLASAGLDPFTTALAVLALCCFMKLIETGEQASLRVMVLMCVALFVTLTTRSHLLPMLLMPFLAAFASRRWSWHVIWIVTTMAIMVWLAIAIPSTVDYRISRSATTGEIARFYLENPGQLVSVFISTLNNDTLTSFYQNSFLGHLYFTTGFSKAEYNVLRWLLLLILFLSLPSWKQVRATVIPRLGLLVVALCSVLLTFLAMLVSWTPHPASFIEGVQGRYFLVPAILLLTAITDWSAPTESTWRQCLHKTRNALLALLFGYSMLVLVYRVLDGFYVS